VSTATATKAPAKTKANPEEKTASPSVKAKIDRLRELRVIKGDAEKEAKEITAELLDWAGPLTKRILWGKTKLATLVKKTHRHADMGILAEAFPEAYTASLVEKPYTEIR
jgi:hypothetical protein